MSDPVRQAISHAQLTALLAAGVKHAQIVSGGSESEISAAQVMVVLPEIPELFVHLRVYEQQEGGVEVPLAQGSGVRTGVHYHVRATASVNRLPEDPLASVVQTGVRPGRPLVPLPAGSEGMGITLPECEPAALTRDRWEEWSYDFEMTISPDVEAETVQVSLELHEQGTDVRNPGIRLSLAVEDLQPRPPRAVRAWLPLGQRPPTGMVFLHVIPYDDEAVRFSGWLAEPLLPALSDRPVRRPEQRTPSADSGGYRLGLFESMNDFAAGEGGSLVVWLEAVLEACRDDCCIVVVDQDPTQAPWELMKLNNQRMLGTHAQVVRWADLRYRNVQIQLPLDEVTYFGRLAALVPHDEVAWLGEYTANGTTSEGDELVSVLLDHPGRVGMVYLSSRDLLVHGDEDEVALERLPNLCGQVRLRFDDLEEALESRPVVFADAPFSGRLLFGRGGTCGIARAAMQRLAAGYVGTLGPVDRPYALETARLFLDRALGENGVCPAELLRELRVGAARELEAAQNQAQRAEAKRRLLNASMFVFYGSPRARVRIYRGTDA